MHCEQPTAVNVRATQDTLHSQYDIDLPWGGIAIDEEGRAVGIANHVGEETGIAARREGHVHSVLQHPGDKGSLETHGEGEDDAEHAAHSQDAVEENGLQPAGDRNDEVEEMILDRRIPLEKIWRVQCMLDYACGEDRTFSFTRIPPEHRWPSEMFASNLSFDGQSLRVRAVGTLVRVVYQSDYGVAPRMHLDLEYLRVVDHQAMVTLLQMSGVNRDFYPYSMRIEVPYGGPTSNFIQFYDGTVRVRPATRATRLGINEFTMGDIMLATFTVRRTPSVEGWLVGFQLVDAYLLVRIPR
ncbi:hypothetical protein C8Q79DRAFT_1025983 [Trametes meyenii]|nr:hypothetical protein C8Q79DRAFT_1025983 [Trametes meyenii]